MSLLNEIEENGEEDDVDDSFPIPSRFRSNLLEENVVIPGSSLESASVINDENEAPPQPSAKAQELEQKYLFALETVRQLRHRLVRRTNVIEEIRKYYLRDIVTMKHVLRDVLSDSERDLAWKHYEANLPSLDLKQGLALHGPSKCEFQVKPCEMCGGQLELVMKDTDEVDFLKKVIREGKDREHRWREKLASLDVQIETTQREKAEATKSHTEEKKVLYAEMRKLKEEIERTKNEYNHVMRTNKKIKDEYEEFINKNSDLLGSNQKLLQAEKELDIATINLEETQESLRQARANEKVIQRELTSTRAEMKDLKIALEKSRFDFENLVQDRQQMATRLEKLKEAYDTTEQNLQTTTDNNLEMGKRIRNLEEELAELKMKYQDDMAEADRTSDSLKYDLKQMEKTHKSYHDLHTQLEFALANAHGEIQQLQNITREQKIELLQNSEELQNMDQEMASMKQFLREQVGDRDSDSDDSDETKKNAHKASLLAEELKKKREEQRMIRRNAIAASFSNSFESLGKFEDRGLDVEGSATPRKAQVTYHGKKRSPVKSSMPHKEIIENGASNLGLPLDADAMLDMNQPEKYDDVPNEKGLQRRIAPVRRKSLPSLYMFRASKSNMNLSISRSASVQSGEASSSPPPLVRTNTAATVVSARTALENTKKLEEMRRLFDRYVTNGDGKRSLEEVIVAATKVQFNIRQGVKSLETAVEIEPPTPDAPPIEVQVRKEILEALKASQYYTENACNRVLNIAGPFIHSLCSLLDRSCSAMWKGMEVGKRGLDFFLKMHTVSEGIISCGEQGVSNGDLAETCAVLVPLAGSTNCTNVTDQWQKSSRVSPQVITELTPAVNFETGERKNRSYDEFFHGDRENHERRISLAQDTLTKMSDFSEGMNATMSDYLVEVLREWSAAKSVFIDLESRIESEKDKVRRTMEAKVTALGKEVHRQQLLNEKNSEKTRQLEKKIVEFSKMEVAFKECEKQLDSTQWKLGETTKELRDLQSVHHTSLQELDQREKEINKLNKDIAKLNEIIASLHKDVEDLNATCRSLEEALRAMSDERAVLQERLDRLLAKEDSRLNKLSTVAVQCEPSYADVEIQTNFLIPPMELKTLVMNKLSKSGIKKYPMVFSQALDYVAVDDVEGAEDFSMLISARSESSRPGTGTLRSQRGIGSRTPSRNGGLGSPTRLHSIADMAIKDGPPEAPPTTLEDFFASQESREKILKETAEMRSARKEFEKTSLHESGDAKKELSVTIPPIEMQQQQQRLVVNQTTLPYINPLTTGVLSRQGSADSLSGSLSNFRAAPPVIGYVPSTPLDKDMLSRIDELPSRKQSYDLMTRTNSYCGISKIGIAEPMAVLQQFHANSSVDLLSPRSINSKESVSTTNSIKIKRGTNAKFHKPVVEEEEAPHALEVGVQSFRSPNMRGRAGSDEDSLSVEQRSASSLRNLVSNVHQEVVNGIVYNHKSSSEHPVFRTESSKIQKEQEIATLREPLSVTSYSSRKNNNGAGGFPSKPRQSSSPPLKLARGKTPMVMDDNAVDSGKRRGAQQQLMSSSLSQAGLSALNSDTMKKMQKELFSR